MTELGIVDPEIAAAIENEFLQQSMTIELNAATNFPSRPVIEAQGSVLACKTLEGYPGRRYHGGHRNVDVIERVGIERVKKLFGSEHANIQPHSGVNANLAVYFATLDPGDGILGMDLGTGGHLSHGHKASITGKFFRASSYGVDPQTELIDYEAVRRIAHKERPKMIVCGASAYPRVIDFAQFQEIAKEVGAFLLADIAHVAGLVAGGVYASPVPYADFVTFTSYKTLRGGRGGIILCRKKYAQKIDAAVFPGVQGSMHAHLMAGKSVSFKLASSESFKSYAQQVVANARALAGALRNRSYRIVSGGTDTHLVLVDLSDQGMSGAQAQGFLEEVNIICNKNTIPFDSRGAELTSGIRLGTAAVTTRGFCESEMESVAEMIDLILSNPAHGMTKDMVKERARELCIRFPLHMDRWEMGVI
jgi:glycine hydroxymethyltransferase